MPVWLKKSTDDLMSGRVSKTYGSYVNTHGNNKQINRRKVSKTILPDYHIYNISRYSLSHNLLQCKKAKGVCLLYGW